MLTIVSIYSKHIGCVLCLLNRTDCYVWIRRKNYWLFVFEMHLLKAWGCTITDKSHVQHYPTINTQLLFLRNTVVLLAFLLRKAPLVFLAVTFSILIFFSILNFPKPIREDFKELQKQKSLCQLQTTELYPKEAKKRVTARKWQKRVWVWCLTLVVFSLSNHADPFISAWFSLTAQEKGVFKRNENE